MSFWIGLIITIVWGLKCTVFGVFLFSSPFTYEWDWCWMVSFWFFCWKFPIQTIYGRNLPCFSYVMPFVHGMAFWISSTTSSSFLFTKGNYGLHPKATKFFMRKIIQRWDDWFDLNRRAQRNDIMINGLLISFDQWCCGLSVSYSPMFAGRKWGYKHLTISVTSASSPFGQIHSNYLDLLFFVENILSLAFPCLCALV